MKTTFLLWCGILSSFLYVAMNIIAANRLEGYSSFSQTISELSAIGTSTRILWVRMGIAYGLLLAAFGWGVLKASNDSRKLRLTGYLLIAGSLIGLAWPPMHQREVLAAGGGSLSDVLHIVFTFVTVPAMMLQIILASGQFGSSFRIYSWLTLVLMIAFGILTGTMSPAMEANQPTPWMGVWERISVMAYMAWIIVLAGLLLYKRSPVINPGTVTV